MLVLHESHLMRSALTSLLGAERDFDVASASWNDSAQGLTSADPRVCLADAECSGVDRLTPGGTLAGQVGGPERGLVVLAHPDRPGMLRRAFAARAQGYVSKHALPQRLVDAIRRVSRGERFVDESLAFSFLEAAEMPLTPRELSVLEIAASGESVAGTAARLHLSQGTVRNYVAAAVRKTGARNKVDAIRIAQTAGWL
ncbi:response regulator transcription factor [Streptomyces sp. RKND-216]|uniref:response regulator transcription factor n=1 Tax=Streptomyces sp. RKND-216 TaxID=2562581 RepID=UPI0032B3E6F1